MINFRYHVVSITSVFLALAVGLVLGTAALNGPVANDLNSRVGDLRTANSELRSQVEDLDKQLAGRDGFVKQVAPNLLGGKLASKRVLVVTLPGVVSEHVSGVQTMLQMAGATVTGTIAFRDAFVDPVTSDDEIDLATRLLPPGMTALPANNNGAETAAALFARVFAAGKTTPPDAARTALLAGFGQLKLVEAAPQVGAADSVVIIGGPPLTGRDADRRNANVLALVSQFGRVFGREVLATPGAADKGNVVAAVRGQDALATTVATVDTVGTAEGQLATALALAEAFAGKPGHYGTGSGATAPLPALSK